ncbi:DUF4440 domain-containing protein [Aurantiacibacter spongiae]|uniref:DUF4440 domain-containing protein n=1 Tax=Aurantiacibacter spongiae TaxID=2488860 RepID=A0A3N5DMU8_9SPHN|nr:DUF4440 domain-containing protein [Aurantiacibacter spongiae]RPF70341.1 DUF4440 domain-containing protein [Aurantiacibacter spongiae]
MAITDEALWDMEKRLWTAPVDECEDSVADECLMVFGQAGILDRDFALAGMRAAPRWASLEMLDRKLARPGKTVAVLAYRACASREGAANHDVLCTSTYRGADDGWKLVQHQQTGA